MLILHSFIESAWPRVDQFLDRMGVRVTLCYLKDFYILLSFSISLISLIPPYFAFFLLLSISVLFLIFILFYSSISLFFI